MIRECCELYERLLSRAAEVLPEGQFWAESTTVLEKRTKVHHLDFSNLPVAKSGGAVRVQLAGVTKKVYRVGLGLYQVARRQLAFRTLVGHKQKGLERVSAWRPYFIGCGSRI